jgi:hypothetical protein
MEPLSGINKMFSLIQNHEKQKGAGIFPLPIGLPSVESTALISRMDNGMNQGFTHILMLDLVLYCLGLTTLNNSNTLEKTNLLALIVDLKDTLLRNVISFMATHQVFKGRTRMWQ